nr:hypothetical protein [Tanacetum cinerariifolium]
HDKSLTLVVDCFQWLALWLCRYIFYTGEVSNIPMVLSWGGRISADGFLPSILLLVVIIAVVVIVAVIVIVVVVGEAFSMLVACASRAIVTLSTTSFLMAAWVMTGIADVDVLLGAILSTFTIQHRIRTISQVFCTKYGNFDSDLFDTSSNEETYIL